jgi:hypothetical protein
MSDADFFSLLVDEVRRLLAPVEEALQSSAAFAGYLRRFGWELAPGSLSIDDIRDAIDVASDLAEAAQALAAAWDEPPPSVEAITQAFGTAKRAIDTVGTLTSKPPPGGLSTALWSDVAGQLPEALVADYLERRLPFAFGAFVVTGLVEQEWVDLSGQAGRVSYSRRRLRLDRLGRALTDPGGVLRETYQLDGGAPRLAPLVDALGVLVRRTELPAVVEPVGPPWRSTYYSSGNPSLGDARQLRVTLLHADDTAGNRFDLGLTVLPAPPRQNPGGAPAGLVAGLQASTTGTPPTEGFWPVSVELAGDVLAEAAVALEVYPTGARVVAGSRTECDVELALAHRPPDPVILLGAPGSHRLQCASVRLSLALRGPAGDPEVEVAFAVGGLELVVETGDADSFLGRIFGGRPQTASFDATVAWSSTRGLRFEGQAGLELDIPINQTIGVVELLSLLVGVRATSGGRAELLLAFSGGAVIGPVAVSVRNVGVLLVLRPVTVGEPRGLLGDLDLAFGFKAPDGLGVAIDTGPVTGGGFLEIDQANGRYAGILQLQAAGIGITAIGLLDTRLPGGAPGYSFLVIVTAKFAPIQLGFGFALTGVGGLAGINRALVADALQAGVRSGSVDHLLFPANPVKDAPRIISDLRTIFPPAAGRYVFGPMLSIVWGASIIEAELGVILTLPAPVVIVLLGQINMALPTRQEAIVELHLDVAGTLDFGSQRLSIDASLHDSRVLAFNLYGDMALRLSWGAQPEFALSVGGLHPLFQPPPGFPELRRLTLALGEGENPRLTMQTYLAVTANSFQIGARAELYAEAAGFNLLGWIGFDALFYFSPFEFRADFTAGIALRHGGSVLASVQLDAHLTGPAPWHAWGEASVSILFLRVTVPFDATFGEERRVDALPGDPWAALEGALRDPRSWSATPPERGSRVVPAAADGDAGPALVDPLGGLCVRQRAVPLHRTLTKFGEGALPAPARFDVQGVAVGGQAASSWAPVRELFAPGPFEELSEADKLTRGSFEPMDAGLVIAASALAFGSAADVKGVDAAYETVQVDAKGTPGTRLGTHVVGLAQQLSVLAGGAVATAGVATSGTRRFAPPPGVAPRVRLGEERWVVAATADLAVRTDVLAAPAARGTAEQALAGWLRGRPADRGLVAVVPEHEAVGA